MRIYIGNLSHNTAEGSLHQTFATYGEVASTNIITDKFTGQSRGFGFVEMPDTTQAKKAIAEMNGKELDGRSLTVNEAKPREQRDQGGFGGRRPGYGGGRSY